MQHDVMFMPVTSPPNAGPHGRTRGRISASSLTTWMRCPEQWYNRYIIGLSSPTTTSQILGILVEDALCGLLMERMNVSHPNKSRWALYRRNQEFEAQDESSIHPRDWIMSKVEDAASCVIELGQIEWDEAIWREEEQDWSDVEHDRICELLRNGLELMLEEVEKCSESHSEEIEFEVPAPCWDEPPVFPLPAKVNSHIDWKITSNRPSDGLAAVWEKVRPWVKDPRVHQPQRLYHPGGWASGELDLVLRWDGNIRLIDIKSGTSDSKFALSLPHQLRFYAWLWESCFEAEVSSAEGWYLGDGERKEIDLDFNQLEETKRLREIHDTMMSSEVNASLPRNGQCDGTPAGCYWCSADLTQQPPELNTPFHAISEIPRRVVVRGKVSGSWGPMLNHHGESVIGAIIEAGGQILTIEEVEEGAFPTLHEMEGKEVTIVNALPGVWRKRARIYLDERSELSEEEVEITRLGLLRTTANISGVVVGIRRSKGVRLDGVPWSLVATHIWDGSEVVELIAWGSSINNTILSIKPGDCLDIMSAELGWRSGLPQLRIDPRRTRLTKH